MIDLHKKAEILDDKKALNQYVQQLRANKDNLFITEEIISADNSEKVKVHFCFENNLPKKSVDKCCNANGVQYGLEYKREITRLIPHIIEEIKATNPFNLKFDNHKLEVLQEKRGEKLLEKYLFSAESNSIPKIDINDSRVTISRELNNKACIYYRKCKVTLPKEKDTDQIRPIKFIVIIENPNYKDKT